MNERIQELAGLAEKLADENTKAFTDGTGEWKRSWNEVYDEKFAELIVQECMWKIMQRREEAIDNDWHVDEAMSAALSDISEHFGVEE